MQLSKKAFERRVQEYAKNRGIDFEFAMRSFANLALMKLISAAARDRGHEIAFKGGASIFLRFGFSRSRFTQDVDALTSLSLSESEALVGALTLVTDMAINVDSAKRVRDFPVAGQGGSQQVVEYRIALLYGESPWRTVTLQMLTGAQLEVGQASVLRGHEDAADFALLLGKPFIEQVNVISLELQIAEKLHGVTRPDSVRGRDLFDIAVLSNGQPINLASLSCQVHKVFDTRATHELPQVVVGPDQLKDYYQQSVGQLAAIVSFENALELTNRLLKDIRNAS